MTIATRSACPTKTERATLRWRRWPDLVVIIASTLGIVLQLPVPAAAASVYSTLQPKAVEIEAVRTTSGTQFLAADREGRVFVLRGDNLEILRVHADASYQRIGRLACAPPANFAFAAAMDSSGLSWLVSNTPFELAICDLGKQQQPPGLTGLVSSLAFTAKGPRVAVVPIETSSQAAQHATSLLASSRVPRVFALLAGRWQPFSWSEAPEIDRTAGVGPMAQTKAATDSFIVQGPSDSLWLASWNVYSIRQAPLGTGTAHALEAGSGRVEWLPRGLNQVVPARGVEPTVSTMRSAAGPLRPRAVIRAGVSGPDSKIYLLVSIAEGLALDRFDPSKRLVERVLLGDMNVSAGPMTATFGAHDLWLGGRMAADGLWRIPLSALAGASWQPVDGARFDGVALRPQ
jgi:hypothetical protein